MCIYRELKHHYRQVNWRRPTVRLCLFVCFRSVALARRSMKIHAPDESDGWRRRKTWQLLLFLYRSLPSLAAKCLGHSQTRTFAGKGEPVTQMHSMWPIGSFRISVSPWMAFTFPIPRLVQFVDPRSPSPARLASRYPTSVADWSSHGLTSKQIPCITECEIHGPVNATPH